MLELKEAKISLFCLANFLLNSALGSAALGAELLALVKELAGSETGIESLNKKT